MKFVKISQPEFESLRKLYEGVMSYACHGLFFREGNELGAQIASLVKEDEDFFETTRKLLVGRGWVEDIEFGEGEVRAKGSVEVSKGNEMETCHRLRGIISKLYEIHKKEKVRFTEVECESTGSDKCLFKMEEW